MTTLTLIALLALTLALASRAAPAPMVEEISDLRGGTDKARGARCLTPLRRSWVPAWRVPAPVRPYTIIVERGRRSRARNAETRCNPLGPPATVELGRAMAAARGWVGYQWKALYEIGRRESGWVTCRHYPSTTNCAYTGSAACGIPQRVPCNGLISRPARAQIRWMLDYIASRYGTPAGALSHHNAVGWY